MSPPASHSSMNKKVAWEREAEATMNTLAQVQAQDQQK
jgi:hypothetical protein